MAIEKDKGLRHEVERLQAQMAVLEQAFRY
jgi:hypothetical protein